MKLNKNNIVTATQIMNLLHLAPDIQEVILNLPPTISGKDRVQERQLKPIMKIVDWDEQRALFRSIATR